MKKKYTFLLLLLFVALHLSAQQHLVLIEEFTNTGCNPCASWSPELDQVIEDRLGECIAIKYHSGYPDSGDILCYLRPHQVGSQRQDQALHGRLQQALLSK